MPLPRLSSTAFRSVVCAATVGLAGCATRTVYVVDDDRVTQPAPAQPALVGAPPPLAADPMTAGPSFADTDFVEPLSPYGSWMSYPGYGMVFIPDATIVGRNFRPYTNGHWEYTEWGWTWVDHHPFGWATGHYGRWFFDARYGWIWVPGSQWAPAWVSWRTGGGYIGWAAMPPGSVVGGGYGVYDTSWVFVTTGNFGAPQVGAVLIWGSSYRSCYGQTQPARGTVVVGGRPV